MCVRKTPESRWQTAGASSGAGKILVTRSEAYSSCSQSARSSMVSMNDGHRISVSGRSVSMSGNRSFQMARTRTTTELSITIR